MGSDKTAASARIRLSPHVMIYFQNGRLVFENYITKRKFYGTSDTLVLLRRFGRPHTASEVVKAFRKHTSRSILNSIQNLLDSGLLIAEGSEDDLLSKRLSTSWLWPNPSRYYHFASKLQGPFSTPEELKKFYVKNLKGRPQPGIYKNYSTKSRVRLLPGKATEAPLFATMRRRQTTRAFSGAPISFRQLSHIMFYTWGKLSTIPTLEFGRLLHKTSPSAGARHPTEVYAVINNVTGIEPGIYHYSVEHHSLELLRKGDFKEKCVEFAAGQSWTREASVFFVMTAVVARTAWKYRSTRVYRAFLLDVGHLSQTFLLVSTALGLGSFCIGIISDAMIEEELGLDGVNEIALFAVGVGHPAKAASEKTLERIV
ncbi:SagB family peptide dehydrogenase [Candidatus Bathyarchaeota archaeon]|nr:SagB family peptide dehydrogenase [Candidatus Bathyarchaeota archaeon]